MGFFYELYVGVLCKKKFYGWLWLEWKATRSLLK